MSASSATLLERASELALLEEAIAATAARAILIEGPAGIGKTALLRAARQGACPGGEGGEGGEFVQAEQDAGYGAEVRGTDEV